jgi:hypothetical protein
MGKSGFDHPVRLWHPTARPRFRNKTWLESQTEPQKRPTSWTAAPAKKTQSRKKTIDGLLKRAEAKLKKRSKRPQPKGKPVRQKGGYLLSAREERERSKAEQPKPVTKGKKKKTSQP